MVKLPLSFFPGELKLPILKLAATEIVSGISGESESRLRELFDKAVASAPCILFIDEIDAITQRRDQTNKGNPEDENGFDLSLSTHRMLDRPFAAVFKEPTKNRVD